MQVDGIDIASRAYRIRLDDGVVGLVPETLVAETMDLGRAPGHGEVYQWLATHSARVEQAIAARRAGRSVRPPFDRITLEESS